MKKTAKRTSWVPYAIRNGMPVALPLFGPASPTFEHAIERLNAAMATGNFVEGSGEVKIA